MPVPAGYAAHGGGGVQPSCWQKIKMGLMMGGMIGASTGILFGAFVGHRSMGLRGRPLLKYMGSAAFTSGGSFAVFMAVAQGIRC